MVHNLVTVAALLGRKPAIPEVPCAFMRAVQPLRNPNRERSRFGVAHPAVVVSGTPDHQRCFFTPAKWGNDNNHQCNHDKARPHLPLAVRASIGSRRTSSYAKHLFTSSVPISDSFASLKPYYAHRICTPSTPTSYTHITSMPLAHLRHPYARIRTFHAHLHALPCTAPCNP